MSHISNHKKKIIPLLILIGVIVFAAYYFGNTKQDYIGVVEATILSHTSEVSGKILEMPIELGTHVSKGDVIAKIDSSSQEYAYEQLKLSLEKGNVALSSLDLSSSESQAENSVAIAQANYNSAVTSSQKASLDYQNAKSLYEQGAIPKDSLDKAKVNATSAANAVTAAKAQLDNAKSQSTADSTRLDIAQTEIKLQEMKEDLEKYTIRAVSDGVIMSKSYILGDMVAPGYNLADLASDDEKYFVFYLPIEYLNNIEYDQTYAVKSHGDAYDAVVKYIDVESEYTPKDMQTTANKNRESIKIKLLLPEGCPLKPGEEANIRLDLEK